MTGCAALLLTGLGLFVVVGAVRGAIVGRVLLGLFVGSVLLMAVGGLLHRLVLHGAGLGPRHTVSASGFGWMMWSVLSMLAFGIVETRRRLRTRPDPATRRVRVTGIKELDPDPDLPAAPPSRMGWPEEPA